MLRDLPVQPLTLPMRVSVVTLNITRAHILPRPPRLVTRKREMKDAHRKEWSAFSWLPFLLLSSSEKLNCRSLGRAPPFLMPWELREQDKGRSGESGLSSLTRGAHREPPSCLLLQAECAHHLPPPAPDTQCRINMPGPGPCGNSGELRLLFPGTQRHQQKFISQTHGYFENQISCSVAIKLGTFQVLLYNRNLFCLQLPFTYKNSISEREAIRVSSPPSLLWHDIHPWPTSLTLHLSKFFLTIVSDKHVRNNKLRHLYGLSII